MSLMRTRKRIGVYDYSVLTAVACTHSKATEDDGACQHIRYLTAR